MDTNPQPQPKTDSPEPVTGSQPQLLSDASKEKIAQAVAAQEASSPESSAQQPSVPGPAAQGGADASQEAPQPEPPSRAAAQTDTSTPQEASGSGEESASSPKESRRELNEAIKNSKEVIFSVRSLLPLFPDTVTLDRSKITIFKRTFFATKEVMSIPIDSIASVNAACGPLFGTVTITGNAFNAPPNIVRHFWRNEAIRLKRVCQGSVMAYQRGIDTSTLSAKELADKFYELGEDSHGT